MATIQPKNDHLLDPRGKVPAPPSGPTSPCHRNGVPVLPWTPEGEPADLALVNSLRDGLIPT